MRKNKNQQPLYSWRYWVVVIFLSFAAVGLIWRMVALTVFERGFLLKQGDARTIRTVSIPAYRGMILDRNGEPLAISTPVESVWANPKDFKPTQSQLSQMANLLGLTNKYISNQVKINSKREFIYIIRQINPGLAKKVMDLKIPGIHLKKEFRRYYPEGAVTAQLLGFTNIDDKGQEGVELEFNKWLQGIPGKKRVLIDRKGRIVADIDMIKEAHPGHNLELSINRQIQFLAYRTLQNTVKKFNAKSGSVVVLDVKTGGVLAMANLPSYNPNNRPKISTGDYRNRAVTDIFEPGSTMKAFSVASALESGKYTPKTIINTSPGYLYVNGHKITDDDRDLGKISVTEVLQKSSNIGVTKMTLSLPGEHLYKILREVGFGQRTDSGFPGESGGILVNRAVWAPITKATLAFGYGISVTTLQLAHAYSVIASGGIFRPISLLKINKPVKGKRVMSKRTTKEMIKMLETVVENGGTGQKAHVRGYWVAGKTGTAYIAKPNGYYKHRYMASFVGLAPATDPQIVVAVVIRDPRRIAHFGGLVAAPAFSKIMGGSLRILDIPPDHLPKTLASN